MSNHIVVFSFGRFNPPTTGHQLVFETVKKSAKSMGADHVIFASPSHDNRDNPLSWKDKLYFLKKIFPQCNFNTDPSVKNIWQAVEYLSSMDYRKLFFVCGNDRGDVAAKIRKYIQHPDASKSLNIDTFEKIELNRGRGPVDLPGVSGTLARSYVRDNRYEDFVKIVPGTDSIRRELFNRLRTNMQKSLKESNDNKESKPLNRPFRIPASEKSSKKFRVYVKNPETGKIVTVNFGDANMEIKRDNPERRKNFKSRHNCSEKKDKTKAGYWSCNWGWGSTSVTQKLKESLNTGAMSKMSKYLSESIDTMDASRFNTTTGAMDGTQAVDDGSRNYFDLRRPDTVDIINNYLRAFSRGRYLDPAYPLIQIRNRLMTAGIHFAFTGYVNGVPPTVTFPLVSLSAPNDLSWEKHFSNGLESSSPPDGHLVVGNQKLPDGGYMIRVYITTDLPST